MKELYINPYEVNFQYSNEILKQGIRLKDYLCQLNSLKKKSLEAFYSNFEFIKKNLDTVPFNMTLESMLSQELLNDLERRN